MIAGAYYGNHPAQSIYLGAEQVWQRERPGDTIPWQFLDAWGVGYGSAGSANTSGPTGSPTGAGTVLVAAVTIKEADVGEVAAFDDIGGTWTLAGRAGEGQSSTIALFVNTNAEGVTSITAGSQGATGATHLHVLEFLGPPGAAVTGRGVELPSAHEWEPVTIDAPVGALVVGAAGLGVSSRNMGVAPPFPLIGEHRQSSTHSLITAHIVPTAQTIGPQWTKEGGGTVSVNAVTAAIYA